MFEYFKYQRKLAKLFREKESLREVYAKEISKARKEGKSGDDIRGIEAQHQHEEQMASEEIDILVTNRLIEKAKRRFIPLPPRITTGLWEKCCVMSNQYVLSDQGITLLRSSLRKEQKERMELVAIWLAPLIGIIGAVTGLVAVIMK